MLPPSSAAPVSRRDCAAARLQRAPAVVSAAKAEQEIQRIERPQPESGLRTQAETGVKLLGVGRAHHRAVVLLASDVEPNAVLRRDTESASERHLRPPLRQAHGNFGRPVPDKRGLVVPPPLVRFLAACQGDGWETQKAWIFLLL